MRLIFLSEQGRNKVTGRLWGFAAEILTLFTFLKVYSIDFPIWCVPLFMGLLFILNYFLGVWYDNMKLIHIETELSNDRNPTMRNIEKKVNERDKI